MNIVKTKLSPKNFGEANLKVGETFWRCTEVMIVADHQNDDGERCCVSLDDGSVEFISNEDKVKSPKDFVRVDATLHIDEQ